jgi:hypothetical protein
MTQASFYGTRHTKATLQHQSQESRLRNVETLLFDRIETVMEISNLHPADRLADVGLAGTSTAQLAGLIAAHFPYVTPESAAALVGRATTLRDLIFSINDKAGASCPPSPTSPTTTGSGLFL